MPNMDYRIMYFIAAVQLRPISSTPLNHDLMHLDYAREEDQDTLVYNLLSIYVKVKVGVRYGIVLKTE